MNNRKEDMEISSHYRQLLRELNEQRQHGILCDACVIVDGKIFKAHKNVLLGSSRYFKTLYCQVRSTEPTETKPQQRKPVGWISCRPVLYLCDFKAVFEIKYKDSICIVAIVHSKHIVPCEVFKSL